MRFQVRDAAAMPSGGAVSSCPEASSAPAVPTLVHLCSVAAFATPERRKRKGGDRRTTEIETALRQSFEAAVELKSYPRSLISLHIMVLQADGGLLPGPFR